jgi:hypothetical protein
MIFKRLADEQKDSPKNLSFLYKYIFIDDILEEKDNFPGKAGQVFMNAWAIARVLLKNK